jgi:two-component system, NtrC family, response regulator AtoC
MVKLLVVDDDAALARTLKLHFAGEGYIVRTAGNLSEARSAIATDLPEIIILDLKLPDGVGLDLLKELTKNRTGVPVIMMTGHHDFEYAVEAMKAEAFDYVHKPVDIDRLEELVQRASEQTKTSHSLLTLSQEISGTRIAGSSQAILELHKQIGLAARSRVTVLIQGESGVGKELVARAIHHYSAPEDPFVAVNCSAIVATLMESELFGHERGSFTGAVERKIGQVEAAGVGTLFLDEIGDLQPELQTKLLRVLQEKTFTRVGGNKSLPFRARVIAATNRILKDRVTEGAFRSDLYYRLSAFEIKVPPLRERIADLPELVNILISKLALDLNTRPKRLNESDLKRLMAYNWPGNVRELENVLTQSILSSPSEVLNVRLDRNDSKLHGEGDLNRSHSGELISLEEVEKRHIEYVLEEVRWHLGEACKILKITRPTLRKKMRDHNIKRH